MADTKLRAVIFDVDGTLVNSNDAHARSWVEALSAQGYEVSFDEIRRRIGMGGDNLLPEVIGQDKDSPVGKSLTSRRKEIFKSQYLPTIQPFSEVPALFRRVGEAGMQRTISSSAEKDELHSLLQIAGVADLAEEVTSSSDAQHSKPSPDPINVALEKAGCAPNQAVMVGDSPYDIEAARKAGVATIALRCGGFSDKDLQGAVALYNDPADLLAHFDESPLNRS